MLQWWLRDVWLLKLGEGKKVNEGSGGVELRHFPQMAGTARVAQRISARDAVENLSAIEQLQRWLHTNVQEALALEVGFLKLRL